MAKHNYNPKDLVKSKQVRLGKNGKDREKGKEQNGNNPFTWQEKYLGIFLPHGLLQRSNVKNFIPRGK